MLIEDILSPRVKSCRHFKRSWCLHLRGQATLDCMTLKVTLLRRFEKPVTIYQSTRRCITQHSHHEWLNALVFVSF